MVSDIRRLVSLRSFFQAGDMEVSTIEKKTSRVLNEMLVKLFNNIMDAEEKAIITEEYKDQTMICISSKRSASRSRAGCQILRNV